MHWNVFHQHFVFVFMFIIDLNSQWIEKLKLNHSNRLMTIESIRLVQSMVNQLSKCFSVYYEEHREYHLIIRRKFSVGKSFKFLIWKIFIHKLLWEWSSELTGIFELLKEICSWEFCEYSSFQNFVQVTFSWFWKMKKLDKDWVCKEFKNSNIRFEKTKKENYYSLKTNSGKKVILLWIIQTEFDDIFRKFQKTLHSIVCM